MVKHIFVIETNRIHFPREIFILAIMSRPAMGPTVPYIKDTGCSFLGSITAEV
jgi:hypothetical protein